MRTDGSARLPGRIEGRTHDVEPGTGSSARQNREMPVARRACLPVGWRFGRRKAAAEAIWAVGDVSARQLWTCSEGERGVTTDRRSIRASIGTLPDVRSSSDGVDRPSLRRTGVTGPPRERRADYAHGDGGRWVVDRDGVRRFAGVPAADPLLPARPNGAAVEPVA